MSVPVALWLALQRRHTCEQRSIGSCCCQQVQDAQRQHAEVADIIDGRDALGSHLLLSYNAQACCCWLFTSQTASVGSHAITVNLPQTPSISLLLASVSYKSLLQAALSEALFCMLQASRAYA